MYGGSATSSDESTDDESAIVQAACLLAQGHTTCLAATSAAVAAVALARRPRRRKRPTLEPRPAYLNTTWMLMLAERTEQLSDSTSKAARDFRRDFRLPYPVFLQLVAAAKEKGWLRCQEYDVGGRPSIPVELKLLAILYVLGSGAPLRTVASLSGMSEPTLCRVLHRFCEAFAADMYDEWIRPCESEEDVIRVMRHYAQLGFPGAVGSSDCMHISWDKTPSQHARYYTGKEGFPTVAYEVTVDHTMRVQAVTRGFHGSANDKTIVRFDGFVNRIKGDAFYKNMEYNLRVNDGPADDPSSFTRVSGAYLIVDNGYHKVSR
jgi:Plant transposon protein